MRISEVKNRKKVALDRNEWTELLKEGRGPPRAVEPMMMMLCFLSFHVLQSVHYII
jgi:hypothetical protein